MLDMKDALPDPRTLYQAQPLSAADRAGYNSCAYYALAFGSSKRGFIPIVQAEKCRSARWARCLAEQRIDNLRVLCKLLNLSNFLRNHHA